MDEAGQSGAAVVERAGVPGLEHGLSPCLLGQGRVDGVCRWNRLRAGQRSQLQALIISPPLWSRPATLKVLGGLDHAAARAPPAGDALAAWARRAPHPTPSCCGRGPCAWGGRMNRISDTDGPASWEADQRRASPWALSTIRPMPGCATAPRSPATTEPRHRSSWRWWTASSPCRRGCATSSKPSGVRSSPPPSDRTGASTPAASARRAAPRPSLRCRPRGCWRRATPSPPSAPWSASTTSSARPKTSSPALTTWARCSRSSTASSAKTPCGSAAGATPPSSSSASP